ncbi:MAG TPA: 1,4-dihydroxy-2-naphthoate polyprenyltransferase [Pseudolysinimonas sp.]
MAKQQRMDPRRIQRARQSNTTPSKPTSGRNRGKSGHPGGRKPGEARPATLRTWIAGARPQTLLLAVAPVVVGTGAASLLLTHWYEHWFRAVLALIVALSLQIAVNYANDYSDGVRGVDTNRVGPPRLVGSGRAKPRAVLVVAIVFFAIAAVAGGILVWRSGQWWLLAVGAVCIAAGWFYTGGKRPYGYYALGELAVFVFFGVVPVAGTIYTQTGTVNLEAWLGGVAIGCFACAVLVVNNLRDRERDAVSRKRTLAVLLGNRASRVLYVVLMLVPMGLLAFYTVFYLEAGYVFFVAVLVLPAIAIVLFAKTATEYVSAMRLTLFSLFVYGVGLAAALAF